MSIAVIDIFLIVVLAYAQWRMPDVVGPTVPFGVRIPDARSGDPTIARARAAYRAILVPLALLAIAGSALLRGAEAGFAVIPVFGFLALMYLDYYGVHRMLAAVKEREGWYAGQRQAAVADAAIRTEAVRYPTGLLLGAVAVIALTLVIGIASYPHLAHVFPVHFGANGQPNGWATKSPLSAFSMVSAQLGVTALFAGISYVVLRTRQELDPAAPAASAARHIAFQRMMASVLLVLCILVDATFLVSALEIWGIVHLSHAALPMLSVIPVLAGALYVILVTLRVGQGGSRIAQPAEAATGFVHRDDDRYWLGGGLYVNREDPAIIVQRRFGVGWTLNFGHPVSWLALAAILAIAIGTVLIHRLR